MNDDSVKSLCVNAKKAYSYFLVLMNDSLNIFRKINKLKSI